MSQVRAFAEWPGTVHTFHLEGMPGKLYLYLRKLQHNGTVSYNIIRLIQNTVHGVQ